MIGASAALHISHIPFMKLTGSVRIGRVGWRTIARGEGDDPWTALTRAVKALTPGLP